METYPNQNRVLIHKNRYKKDFLQIGIDEWQEASKCLTPSAFKIYLYLAGNSDGFTLALSKQDIQNKLNISFTRYYEAIALLKKKKYLCAETTNTFHFFTTPNPEFENQHKIHEWEQPELDIFDPKSTALDPFLRKSYPKSDIEIDNTNKEYIKRYPRAAGAVNRAASAVDGIGEIARKMGF